MKRLHDIKTMAAPTRENISLSGLQLICLVNYHHGKWHTGIYGYREGAEVYILINSQ